jgi:hypothetical protein
MSCWGATDPPYPHGRTRFEHVQILELKVPDVSVEKAMHARHRAPRDALGTRSGAGTCRLAWTTRLT